MDRWIDTTTTTTTTDMLLLNKSMKLCILSRVPVWPVVASGGDVQGGDADEGHESAGELDGGECLAQEEVPAGSGKHGGEEGEAAEAGEGSWG